MGRNKADLLSGINQCILHSKFIANNTLKINYADGSSAIRLHDTDVVTYQEDRIIFNSGGWRTTTTKDRMNISPFQIYQEDSEWYVVTDRGTFYYYDGITFDTTGTLLSEPVVLNKVAKNKFKRQVSNYCDAIKHLDKLPMPSGGDCLICRIDDMKHTCLQSHLDETYIHGTILINAMREKGYDDNQIGLYYQLDIRDTFIRAIRSYFKKHIWFNQ